MFYTLLVLIVCLDQGAKLWIRSRMELGESIPVWDGFRLTYFENSGAMGSSFEGYGTYFVIPAILITIGAVYLYHKGSLNSMVLKCGAAIFVGGAVGNAIDRIVLGKVTDFLDFGRGISNLADHAISLGMLLILIHTLIIGPVRQRRLSAKSAPVSE
ncbi:signal peptidase II [Paenibacillus cellulosilyticus]|uniref:Lipoprotein signal peptidase n=1 Tax=Paenibacillus cellulosilyticus TaxID=375489 RepID=A0A2V2YLG3_9BACL|nr:signal peptidase II [Paenibacillus cellulosilyticus]PWV94480.1 signal peptidase II [Paenibacillus cellulosilyticus]QKS44993.1 signal peptidase II [Paenibacillus cellulosilyticus]